VARDWQNKVKEAADLVKLYTYDAQKCRKNLASNKGFSRFDGQKCRNVEQNVEARTVGIID
jgi:ribosome biogenesis protein Tsr3